MTMTKAPATAHTKSPTTSQKTLIDKDRRHGRRLRLELETIVPVIVRGPGFVQRGLARNVSEGGMLIEIERPPSIGSRIEIRVAGVKGSLDAPDAFTVFGEVRHQVFWTFAGKARPERMNAVGVRFVENLEPSLRPIGASVH